MSAAESMIQTPDDLLPDEVRALAECETAPSGPSLDAYLDRLLEKMRELRAQQDENTEVAKRRVAMIEAWVEEQNATLANQYAWLERRVTMHAVGYDYGAKKSRTLPNGKFGKRTTTRAGIRVVDEDAALAFAKENDIPAVKVTEKVLVTPLKEWAESTGKVPAGCEPVAEVESYYVEVAK